MDPHLPEYLAAARHLHEQTPQPAPRTTYAVGDFVSGISCGKHWSGRIEWFSDNGVEACVDVGGAWIYFSLKDITH